MKVISKKGQVAVSAVATLLVTVGLMFILGFWVYTKVNGKISQTGFTTAQNTTLDDLRSNINDGFVIGGISLLLIAVVAVISLIKSM
jgi:hypothetical protein